MDKEILKSLIESGNITVMKIVLGLAICAVLWKWADRRWSIAKFIGFSSSAETSKTISTPDNSITASREIGFLSKLLPGACPGYAPTQEKIAVLKLDVLVEITGIKKDIQIIVKDHAKINEDMGIILKSFHGMNRKFDVIIEALNISEWGKRKDWGELK